jgi:predicted nucleic acid-binding protein
MGYLVDSNVLIDYVANRFTKGQLKALDIIFDEAVRVSVITKIELLGYNSEGAEEAKMLQFLRDSNIIPLTDDLVERTITIKKAIKIKTPEAIIAATALINDYTLITNNTSDFKRITQLKLFNPYDL